MHEPFEAARLPTSVHAEIISLTRNDSRVYATRAQMCPQVCGWRRMGPKSRELAKFSQCTNHSRQRAAHLLAVHVAIISPLTTTAGWMSLVHECARRCAAGVEWVLNRENSPSSHHARTIRGSKLFISPPFTSPSSHRPATTARCTSPVRECVRRCAAGVEWFLNRENSPSSHRARTI